MRGGGLGQDTSLMLHRHTNSCPLTLSALGIEHMSQFLSVRVDPELKQRLREISALTDVKESELIRFFVIEGLSQFRLNLKPVQKPKGENLYLVYTPTLLPHYIKEAAIKRAKSKGMRLSRWIAALIQSNILGKPVVVHDEVIALRESSRYLLAIGRNVNQIAKALNETFYETDRVKVEMLKELDQAIKNTDDKIDHLIRTSQKAWCAN